jgi:hypothetical protein
VRDDHLKDAWGDPLPVGCATHGPEVHCPYCKKHHTMDYRKENIGDVHECKHCGKTFYSERNWCNTTYGIEATPAPAGEVTAPRAEGGRDGTV